MNVRSAALLLLLAALLVGAFLTAGGHGSAQAAKTPATCSFLLNDSFANDSVPWVSGPSGKSGRRRHRAATRSATRILPSTTRPVRITVSPVS